MFKGILNNFKKSFKNNPVLLGSSSCTWWPTGFLQQRSLNLPYIWAIVNSLSNQSGEAINKAFEILQSKKFLFNPSNHPFQ